MHRWKPRETKRSGKALLALARSLFHLPPPPRQVSRTIQFVTLQVADRTMMMIYLHLWTKTWPMHNRRVPIMLLSPPSPRRHCFPWILKFTFLPSLRKRLGLSMSWHQMGGILPYTCDRRNRRQDSNRVAILSQSFTSLSLFFAPFHEWRRDAFGYCIRLSDSIFGLDAGFCHKHK